MKNPLGFNLFACASLALAGCAWQPEALYMSPELPDHVRSAFVDSSQEWNRAQDTYSLKVVDGPSPNGFYNVLLEDLPEGKAGGTKKDKILISPGAPEGHAWLLASHELGHWLGWNEHTQEGVMRSGLADIEQCIDSEAAGLFGGKGTCGE